MNIERAKVSDFLEIAALDRVAWQGNRRSEFIPDGEHVWRIWCEHAFVFVARDTAVRGAILAFMCNSGLCCLHKIFVAADARGHGIATTLFERLLAETDARGLTCFLTVDPTNSSARALYSKMGFTRFEYVKGYYRPEEDRIVMVRKPGGVSEAKQSG